MIIIRLLAIIIVDQVHTSMLDTGRSFEWYLIPIEGSASATRFKSRITFVQWTDFGNLNMKHGYDDYPTIVPKYVMILKISVVLEYITKLYVDTETGFDGHTETIIFMPIAYILVCSTLASSCSAQDLLSTHYIHYVYRLLRLLLDCTEEL